MTLALLCFVLTGISFGFKCVGAQETPSDDNAFDLSV